MTLPYIPGWWDSISGNATKLAGQLPQVLQPNSVAQKRLQEMVQQNPMLMEQFANMDDGTRAQLAQSLGFRGQNPLGNLPVGAERQERERVQQIRTSLTPEQQSEADARTVGAPSKYSLTRRGLEDTQKDTRFEQETIQNDLATKASQLNLKLLTGKVKDFDEIQADLEKQKLKYPDLAKVDVPGVVKDLLYKNKSPDPGLVTLIRNNPGAEAVFEMTYKVEMQRISDAAARNIANIRVGGSSGSESVLYLKALTETGNQLNDAVRSKMAEVTAASKNPFSPEAKNLPALKDELARLQRSQVENAGLVSAYQEHVAGQKGIPTGTVTAAPPPAGQVGPEEQAALNAIQRAPQNAAAIRARYKQRTGKDLP